MCVPSLGSQLDVIAAAESFSGVVRVERPGRPLVERAYGLADKRHEIPNRIDTQFGIASGTKSLTALTVVSLIEEGRFELATTARSLLGDDLPLIADDVTIEHLLSHRSGIGDYLDEEVDLDFDAYLMPVPVQELATTEQYLPILDGYPTKFPAGERFGYCNSGFVVLALIAERVSGVPFPELLRERVCEPAGMVDTAFLRSDELPGSAALGYLEVDGAWRTNVFHLPVRGTGDGGIYTTVADVSALWSALFAWPDRLGRVGCRDRSGAQRGDIRVGSRRTAIRPRLLAPRLDGRRDDERRGHGRLVSELARSALRRHVHGDLEHGRRGRGADAPLWRSCSL